MKISKLFPFACVALMMTACASDKEEIGNGTKPSSDPQYLAVNIVNVGATPTTRATKKNNIISPVPAYVGATPTTRATDDDYENGTTDESTIKKVRFYFFNGDGSPYLIKDPNVTGVTGGDPLNWLEASPSDDTSSSGTPSQTEKITQTVLVINGIQSAAPAAIVAVVNPETVDAATLKNGGTMRLSELRYSAVGSQFYKKDATGKVSDFVMSNSVYVNAGEDVCASLVAGHVTTSPETAETKPVNLYVERVVAKVTADVDKTAFKVGDGTDWDATKYGTIKPVGKSGDYNVYAVIDGWGLADENGKAEVEKQVNKTWADGTLGFTPWTTADYHRCFWETSVAIDPVAGGNQPVNPTFNQLKANKMKDVLYTLPNTPGSKVTDLKNNDLTKFAVAATLKYKDASGNWHNAEICRYNGVSILGIDNLKKQVALTFSQYYTSTDGTHYTQLSKYDIDFKNSDGTMQQYRVTPTLAADPIGTTKKYYTKTTSGTTPSFTEVDKTKVLAAIEADKAEIRMDGKAYYYVPIKHLGGTGELAEYGIVRNHFYKITLTGITGFGTPVYDPDKVVSPAVPTYENTFLAARVQVLQWRVVNQNASLGD